VPTAPVESQLEQTRTSDFRWTVLVLMGADTIPTERDLSTEALDDLAEMEEIEDLAAAPTLNILVQHHGRDGVVRGHIGHGESKRIPIDPEQATDGSALLSFMQWAVTHEKVKHRPRQDRLLLVLWGHSYDFAIGRTKTRTGIDGLDFVELADVLGQFTRGYGQKIDIVSFDACQVATVEMAYELRDVADYLLSSQIGIPLPGWPYDRIFDRIAHPKGALMGPAELGAYIVRRYCERYHAEEDTVSLTMLDLKCAAELARAAETLARSLAVAVDGDRREARALARLVSRAQTLEDEPFIDVADLCVTLLRECGDRRVRLAAENLGDLLISPGPVFANQSLEGKGRPFIVEHGRNACETARLHGVSLYAPHVSTGHDADAARPFYDRFRFVQETMWANVIREVGR
jgi:hypothetical protein